MKKIKKITPYLAASLALIASSAAPTHAATISTGAAILQGNLSQDPNLVLQQIFNNPALIQTPQQFGLTGLVDFDQQVIPSLTPGQRFEVRSDVSASGQGNNSLTTRSGSELTGFARGRFAINSDGDLQLAARSRVGLPNGGGSPQNGAISLAVLDFTSRYEPVAGQTGNTVNTQFTFDVRGVTRDQSASAQSIAGAAIRVNGQTFVLGSNIKGNTTLTSPFITVPTNTDVPIQLVFGTGANIFGSSSAQTQETEGNFGDTFRITGINNTNPTTGAPVQVFIPTDIPNPTGGAVDLGQAAQVGAVAAQIEAAAAVPEPPATLGLLLLGAGVVGSTQLKKRKLASKKA